MKTPLGFAAAFLWAWTATALGQPSPAAPAQNSEASVSRSTVFSRDQEGYHTFRIPSLLVTRRGTLLALCEGRRQSAADSGDVDLVSRRSSDGGKTWTPLRVVWDDGPNTCGNPCPVLDSETGTIWLLLTWNLGSDREGTIISQKSQDTRRVFVTKSTDDGVTWAAPSEITANVKPTNWTWYATGPGAGIQILHGPKRGRLVIPCDHMEAGNRRYRSHVIYSDDHGSTWQLGGSAPADQVNECEVVELAQGRLLLNMRNYDPASPTRQIAFSADGGQTWTDQQHATELIDPVCQASIRRLRWSSNGVPGVVLFSNPASRRREKMTLRASLDDGRTWPGRLVVDPGPSAYSCLAALPEGSAGLLYERGDQSPYEEITFIRLSLKELAL